MKKSKKLLLTIPAMGFALSTMAPVVTSCSSEDKLVGDLMNDTINEFKEIDKIPHCSNVRSSHSAPFTNLDKIREYYKGVVEGMGLKWYQQADDQATDPSKRGEEYSGNCYFDIPATKGWEDKPVLALQGHIDIVYVNKSGQGTEQNYKINVVEKRIDGQPVICSDGTTNIGADNGVGIATMLALAKNRDRFNHGPIRCIFTTDEEEGCEGAANIEPGFFKYEGRDINDLLNLDNETLSDLCIATSGVYRLEYYCDFAADQIVSAIPNNFTTYKVRGDGFLGGHTMFISERMDPLIPILNTLNKVIKDNNVTEYYISDLNTESVGEDIMTTSIPEKAHVTISLPSTITQTQINTILQDELNKQKQTYKADSAATCAVETVSKTPGKFLNKESSISTLKFLSTLPDGHYPNDPNNEEKQVNGNLSALNLPLNAETPSNKFVVIAMLRYFDKDEFAKYKAIMDGAFETFTEEVEHTSWKTNSEDDPWLANNNEMLQLVEKAYKKNNVKYKEVLINAGIETTNFTPDKVGHKLNMASIGPTIKNVHATNETLMISSLEPMLKIILYCIKNI